MNSGSSVQVNFPPDLTLPESITCSLQSNLLQSVACSQDLTCLMIGGGSIANIKRVPNGLITAQFSFTNSPLPANTSFTFVISNIGNPPSTKPVQVPSVYLINELGYLVPEITGTLPTFQMQTAAEVA